MKKILIVATGGTIGSSLIGGCRRLNAEVAKSTLINNFFESGSEYAERGMELFLDSKLKLKTLSENMTTEKLWCIAEHIRSFDECELSGIIVLHGTDTLAFSTSLFSMMFCDVSVPMIFVSGNCPPDDEASNANVNFRAAVELICRGLAPNVYAVYRNSDKKTRLYLGSTLMQCPNFSEDFYSASADKIFELNEKSELYADDIYKCLELSKKRQAQMGSIIKRISHLDKNVLLVTPYTGMDYSRIDLNGISGIVHGTYHSGTVCVDKARPECSAVEFSKRCRANKIPVYLAPCKLDERQYESAYTAKRGGMMPLSCTTEIVYCKLLLGLCAGLRGKPLKDFMLTEINGEMI